MIAALCPVCGHPETVHGAGGYPTCVDCGGRCTAPPRTEPETLVEFLHARLGENPAGADGAVYESDIRIMDVCEAAIEQEQPDARVAVRVLELMAKRYETHPGYRGGEWTVMW